jgi:hypothetical protein
MIMKLWWNDTGSGIPKDLDEHLSKGLSTRNLKQGWYGHEPEPQRGEAGG